MSITILDGNSDTILDDITQKHVLSNVHAQSLKDYLETFVFETLSDKPFAHYLTKRNRLIIPGEDGNLREFVINENKDFRTSRYKQIWSRASYLDLEKAKPIKAHKTEPWTALQHVNQALAGTEWKAGNIAYTGIRSITFDNNTDPFRYLKRIAREFGLELDFRIEHDGYMITGRYVDLVERLGQWRGREVELGKDLQSLERNEKTDQIVTALVGYGPEREDGTRLEVFVENLYALQRWGRNGQHLVGEYEPETANMDMSLERLTELTKAELEKRINAVVEYKGGISDLENTPGREHEQIRFADTIRIKDTSYEPALYLEARIHTQKRDIFNKARKEVQLGDYHEYTADEVHSTWKDLQKEIEERLKQERTKIRYGITEEGFRVIKKSIETDKSTVNERFAEIIDNPNLVGAIRQDLSLAKAEYDSIQSDIVALINQAGDTPSDDDKQALDVKYDTYKQKYAVLSRLFDVATDNISTKKDSVIQGQLDEANAKLVDAEKRLIDLDNALKVADKRLDDAYKDLDALEHDLDNLEIGAKNLLRNADFSKQDNIDRVGIPSPATSKKINRFEGFNKDFLHVTADNPAVGENLRTTLLGSKFKIIEGQTYTLSFIGITSGFVSNDFDYTLILRNGGGFRVDTQKYSKTKIGEASTVSATYDVNYYTMTFEAKWTDDEAYPMIGTTVNTARKSWISIADVKLEKGNKATDWTPAPEDKLNTGEAADDINAGNKRIDGKNLIVDGDVLFTGEIAAPTATFLDLTTRRLTAIDSVFENATVKGLFNANEAVFKSGTFEDITAIGGTFENVRITGEMIAGKITGVDITGSSFKTTNTDEDWPVVTLINKDGITQSRQTAKTQIAGGVLILKNLSKEARYSGTQINANSPFEIYAPELVLKTEGNDGWELSTKDSFNHGFIKSGDVGLKFTNSGAGQMQVRNAADSAYAHLVVGDLSLRGDKIGMLSNRHVSFMTSSREVLAIRDDIGDKNHSSIRLKGLESYTASGSANLTITSDFNVARSTSARKYKKDIEPLDITYAENFFKNAQPVWFRSKAAADPAEYGYYGYIADDVAEFDPRMVVFSENGEPEGFNYDRVPALLHTVMKKDRKRLDDLEQKCTIESPQVLLSTVLFDVELKAGHEHEIILNEKFAKAVSNMAVFPSQPVTIRKEKDRFFVVSEKDQVVDFEIKGIKKGFENTYWLDMEDV